jgi:predicted RNase H-like HicB family nuclease
VIYREGDYYVAQRPNVDVSSFGDSEDDAVTNLSEASALYFEDAPSAAVTQVEAPTARRLSVQHA